MPKIIQNHVFAVASWTYGQSNFSMSELANAGEEVKRRRMAMGMTQAELAKEAGLGDGQTISNLESGVTSGLKLGNARSVATVLEPDSEKRADLIFRLLEKRDTTLRGRRAAKPKRKRPD